MLALFRVLHSGGALRPSRGAGGTWELAQPEAKQGIVLIYKTSTVAPQLFQSHSMRSEEARASIGSLSSQTKWLIQIQTFSIQK